MPNIIILFEENAAVVYGEMYSSTIRGLDAIQYLYQSYWFAEYYRRADGSRYKILNRTWDGEDCTFTVDANLIP